MENGDLGSSGYWIDGPAGCPIGGPFDLWRPNYFHANGEPPEDTQAMYPSLTAQTVADVAVATVRNNATLEEVLSTFSASEVELTAAHRYFSEWRKNAPFMPDSMQDTPVRPSRTSPEPLDEFLDDLRHVDDDDPQTGPELIDLDISESEEDRFYEVALKTVGTVARLPVVRVDREMFLRKQFRDSPHIDRIVADGPHTVYSVAALEKKAKAIVRSSTAKTSLTSFAAGLPANPVVMVAAGGADVAQYFGFAINLAQQLAYLFGEDELFTNGSDHLSEEDKIRVIAYLGAMLGASGAAALVANTSKVAGQNIGKKVAAQALTKTSWYPLVKKVGALLGQTITKKTVEKTITKAVPVIGGVVSGGLTYFTFGPMGRRLASTLARNLEAPVG